MPVSLSQLTNELPKRIAAEAALPHDGCTQPGCNNKASGAYTLGGNFVCSDCYFEALGNFVEQHPIGRPTLRSGCGPID